MTLRLLPFLFAAGILLAACDTADHVSAADELSPTSITSDAAEVVANALGVAPGGALNDLAEAALASQLLGDAHRGHEATNPGCSFERAWDEDIQRWIRSIECERGEADGPFYALFARTHHFGFFDAAGEPVQRPGQARTMSVDLVSGEGIRRTPRMSHTLLDIGASFLITDVQEDFVTVNGDYARAGTETMRARAGERTITYELSFEALDVVGPRHAAAGPPPTMPPAGAPLMGPLHRRWAHAVSGTIAGEVSGLITMVTPEGTREREFSRSFVITFGDGERGTARIRFSDTGETFVANLETGDVRR